MQSCHVFSYRVPTQFQTKFKTLRPQQIKEVLVLSRQWFLQVLSHRRAGVSFCVIKCHIVMHTKTESHLVCAHTENKNR